MKKILFQGDSITDADREKTEDYHLGYGYATLVAAEFGMDYPGEYQFYNRGVSGNRIVDLLARVRRDLINLKPDYLSILIGVNDAGFEVYESTGVEADLYEQYYDMLITQVRQELPNIKIMILEPFLLYGKHSAKSEEGWVAFRFEVEKRATAARRIAQKHHLTFVPLLEAFDLLATKTSADLWIKDGIHPTAAGHELIKRQWLKGFRQLTGEI